MKQFYPRMSQTTPRFHISNTGTRLAGVFLLTLILNVSALAAPRYLVVSLSNWANNANWSATSGGAGGASFPVAGDDVFIEGGRTVAIGAPAAAANVFIETGSFLTSGTFTLTVSGNFLNNGTFTAGTGILTVAGNIDNITPAVFNANSGTVNLAGNWNNTGNFTAGTGIVNFNRVLSTQTLNAGASSFYNLTHNGSGTLQLVANNLTVSNNLLNNPGSFDPNGLNITSGLLFTVSGGTFSGGAGSLTTVGLTISGGTLVAPSGTFNVSGNWLRSSGTFTPGTNTVNFTATSGTQTLNSSGIASPFFNISHSGAGILQLLTSDVQTNGSFTNGISAGNFDAGGRTHSVTGLTTINAGAYLATGTQNFNGGITLNTGGALTHTSGAINLRGNWTNNGGTFTPGTNTININGSTAQTIGGTAATTFNGLTVANTASSVVTLTADVTVLGLLNISAAANFNLAARNLTIAGITSPTLTGTFNTATSTVFYTNGSSTAIAAANYFNLNLSGGPRTNIVAIGIANVLTPGSVATLLGTVSFNGTGSQTIPALAYANLQTATAGTKSLAGNTIVSAVLTVEAPSTIALGSHTLTFSGSGTPLVVNGSFVAGTSTVHYSSGSATFIAAVDYYNLTSTNNSRGFVGSSVIGIANNFIPGAPSYSPNTSTVNFNGATGTQTFAPAFTFYNVSISNPNGLTIGGLFTVSNLLNFNSGKINTGTNIVALFTTANITGAGAGKYVNGNLRLDIAAGTNTKAFEIGDASFYAPVQISFPGAPAANLTAFTTSGDHPQINISEINPAKSVNRTWNFTSSVAGGLGAYTATFNFVATDIDAGSNTSLFSVNNYTTTTNSWAIPTIGTRAPTSTQITGTGFGSPGNTVFQVGEAAPETPCAFGSNTFSGSALSPCITDLANNVQPLTISGFAAGQYFTLDVIKGINYRIYTANVTNPTEPLMMSIYNENAPSDPVLAVSFSNSGNTFTQPNNVFYLFTASISGKVRVLINKKRDCSATTPSGLTVKVDTWGGANTLDNQTAAGTNSWVAHIYDGVTNVPFTGTFNNYVGYYTQPESFDDEFGTTGDNDANCFNGIYSGGNLNGTSLKISSFSARYRMNSTKKGLYIADIGSDDGSRLAVDGTLIYAHNPIWTAGQSVGTGRPRILMQLTGTSALQLDYHEGSGNDRIYFNNFIKVIGNDLSTGIIQANCQGNAAAKISGDTLALPPSGAGGLFRAGNTTGYKWYYSLTPGGTRILLPNDTLHSFTPNTAIAPFNLPNTYYIYRTVSLRSENNVNATASPYVQTIESNPAVLTVSASAPLQTVTTAAATFCYGNSATVNLASSTLGINYQLRNNSNNNPLGGIVAGTGGPLSMFTGPLFATTTVNVTAINPGNGCAVKMTNLVTFTTAPDGGKSVFSNFTAVCVGNNAIITVANADAGVRYLLRNDADNSPVGDTLTGVGDSLDLQIPVGYLLDPVTTFHVWAFDIASGCAGKLLDTVKIATLVLASPVFEIDQDFCSLDSGKVLLTPTNTPFASYQWSTDSTTSGIVIQQSGVFTLTATGFNGCRTTKSINVGEELLINGDFSLGRDIGYKTQYIWGPPGSGYPSNPQNNGFYTIAPNAKNTHNDFWGRDHTSKTGNFMIINGENSTKKVWHDTVIVEANTRYYFSAWAMSLNDKPPFSITRFKVDNMLVGDSAILPPGVSNNSNYGWRRFYGQWDSGPTPRDASNNRIPIEIVNLVPGNAGNDFGLDDISFSKLSPVKFFGASIGNGGNSLCLGDTLKLTGDLTGGQNPISYQWSGPGGYNSTLANPVIFPASAGTYYLTATEGRNCQSQDSIFIILGDPTASGVAQGPFKCQTGISMYVSGMVPNSINNTVYYTISTVGTRVATGVDADASGSGAFYIAAPPTTYDGKTLTITSISNGSCGKAPLTTVSTVLIVKPNNNSWVGGSSGNWVDPWNWCPGVPGTNTDVTIPTGVTIFINSNDSARVRNVLLQGNALVKVNNGGRLMLYGDINFSSTGKINAMEGTIETKKDNGNQDLPANFFVNASISTLLLGNTNTNGKTTITNDTLRVLSALLFANNAADLETTNLLVLSSSDTATARVGVIAGNTTQNVITGNFIVERYLLNGAKWRLLAAPTNRTGQTVNNSWQETGILKAGYGTKTADPRHTAGNTLGFDQFGANGSVKRWNQATQNFAAVANTNALPMSDERGYMIFVQGDRSVTFPTTNATRLRTAGTLNRGTQTSIPVAANQFVIIGNPYASRTDIRNISRPNVDTAIYVWDPSLGGAYGLGQFNTLFKDGANYRNTLTSGIYGPALSISNYIESGMAFMVKGSNVTGSVVFEENDKVAGSMVAEFVTEDAQRLQAKLKLAPQGNNPAILLDGVIADFNENYSNGFDGRDIRKMTYAGETTAWKTTDSTLVLDRRSTPINNDTLHLQMGLMRAQNYQWELTLDNMDYPGMNAYLVDRFNATSTLLSMTGTTVVNFNVQNISGSYAADRFKIVFKTASVLPVTITRVTANRQADKSVQVKWNSEQELNLQGYEVERSTNGRNFISIATQAPSDHTGGRANYSSTDNQYLAGDLFYRIKATSLDGQVQYSAVVKVVGIKTTATVTVHPNPVTGKRLNVRFLGMETGSVRLMLVNVAGQVVHTSILMIGSSNLTESIQLSTGIAAGSYQLIITAAAGFKTNQQVIIQ